MKFSDEIKNAEVKFGREYPVAQGYTCVISNVELENYNDKDTLVLFVDIAEGPCAGCYADRLQRVFITLEGDNIFGESNAANAKKTLLTIAKDNIGIFAEDEDIFAGEFNELRLIGCTIGVVFQWDKNNPKFVKAKYVCSKAYAEKVKVADKPKEKTPSEEFTPEENSGTKKPLFGRK